MATKTKAAVEVLATWSGRGVYGLACQSRVVRRRGKVYLVHDGYSGEGTIQGGTYRPYIYEVPAALVDRVVSLVANGSEDDGGCHCNRIAELEYEIVGDLKTLGKQGNLDWTDEL